MGLKPVLSFSSGELDPVLHDFVTLEKFGKGLKTARNVMIGRTGTILSRFSRAHFIKAKNSGTEIKIYSPPNYEIITEWGYEADTSGYVRFYDFDGNLLDEEVTWSPGWDLDSLSFDSSKGFLYVFSSFGGGKWDLSTYADIASAVSFETPATPDYTQTITPLNTPSGYYVDYAVSYVYNGEEYQLLDLSSLGTYNKPYVVLESNELDIKLTNTGTVTTIPDKATEIRVYRRPENGNAFGFIGSSSTFTLSAGDLWCSFIDVGADADFTNNPPSRVTNLGLGGSDVNTMKTGAIYQQRLLLGNHPDDEEAIVASRPVFQNNFDRDYPYDADSALLFKSGSSGKAKVLSMIDNDGLIVFTSIGVFVNLGVLSNTNNTLEKKSPSVIIEGVKPLSIPGGTFFADKKTNNVKQFIYSEDIGSYQTVNHSIYSAHLFKRKTITSWCFQDGVAPLIIVTFSDGTFATFTYDYEHKMRAWTRHDSEYPVEQVAETSVADSTFFVTNKDGQRYIEVSLPRYIPADTYEDNPEADKLALNYLMDAAKTKSNLLNDSLTGTDVFELTPIVADTWDGNLTLTCGTSGLFPVSPGLGAVGTIFRHFSIVDRTNVDLEVISRTSDNEVVVKPSATFPSDEYTDFRLYETFNQVTGLTHLEGENVSVVVDGYVINSPNNDIDNLTPITVSGGIIDLPNSERGAIIIVGRPITADVKTLNISTVEQQPTTIESLTVDKAYIRVQETRGLYISNKFPEEIDNEVDGSSVKGMDSLTELYLPENREIIGNRYEEPVSRRIEQTLPGEWDSQGQMAIRQVDPVHFEIMSITPDVEVMRRSNN